MSAEAPAISLLHERFLLDYPQEAARALESIDEDAAVKVLLPRSAPARLQIWQVLSPDRAALVLMALPTEDALLLLAEADPQVCVAALAHLESTQRESLLAALQPHSAQELRKLMEYPANTAGHMMDPRIAALSADLSIADAIERFRSIRQRGLRELFVVDDQMRLIGQIEIEDLLLANRDHLLVRGIMRSTTAWVRDLDSTKKIVRTLQAHPSTVLPVVDELDRLVGVIRYPQLLGAARLDGSVHMQTIVGAGTDERALSSAGLSVRRRLPWLQINLLTTFLAAAVVGLFQSTIAKYTVLAVLLPIVAGQAGNAGAQALAVTVRGLVMREVQLSQWLRIACKEVVAGLANGVAVTAVAALGIYIWSRSASLALIIAVAMMISMITAGLAGVLIPVVLQRMGLNPARAASITLTTVTNIVGFASFLGVATLLGGL